MLKRMFYVKLPVRKHGVSFASKSQLRLILPAANTQRKLRFLVVGFSFIPNFILGVFCADQKQPFCSAYANRKLASAVPSSAFAKYNPKLYNIYKPEYPSGLPRFRAAFYRFNITQKETSLLWLN